MRLHWRMTAEMVKNWWLKSRMVSLGLKGINMERKREKSAEPSLFFFILFSLIIFFFLFRLTRKIETIKSRKNRTKQQPSLQVTI